MDEALDKFKVFKTKVKLQQGSLIKRFRTDRGGIECIFVGYAEHSKAFRFYVIEPNGSVAINLIIESRDAIFDERRKLKINGTVEKFKARLVIQGFKQKSWIDYFDTYALVARISTIRLLIAMASIHSLIIHQMDVKIAFLNDKLDEEVDLTKEFLSLKFSMKDMGEAEVIMGIRIKHESNGIAIFLSHYTEKVLKKFNYFDCTPVSTPMDTNGKLITNNGQAVSQLKYTSNPVLEGYTDASWIRNTKYNSSISGWVILLSGGVIYWASKKQTCITGSTMGYEFMALATATEKEDEVVNFLMVNLFEKLLSRSMNKEEPPMNCTKLERIVGNLVYLWVQFIPDNKAGDLDKISIDDLYNNFKIVKQEVKRNAGPSSSSGSQNMAFVSTPSTSNNDDVSTVFWNLEQIHKDDLEEMDLKWKLTLLSMRDKRFFQKTGKKTTINGSDTAGYDKAKENRTRNQETTRRSVNMKDTSSKSMVAIGGAGFDWSYMADDEAPTNMAFMIFSESEESEGEDEVEYPPEIERKTVEPSVDKVEVDITNMFISGIYLPALMERSVDIEGSRLEFDGGYVAFGGGAKGDVSYFKLANTKYFVLSPNFKLADESYVLLKVPRENNMYNVDMRNIVPKKDLTCLIAKATNDESMLWHRRLGHINFKNINKLVKENLVRATKDETSRILKSFITEIENLVGKKVKIIRCDNGTEFKNSVMNKFCEEKDHLGKFDGKLNEGFFVGYSTNSKAFRVYNYSFRRVEEKLHINFLENKPIIIGDEPKWLFEIEALTESINYIPVIAGTNSNDFAGKRASFDAGQSSMETRPSQDYILMPLWNDGSLFDYSLKDSNGDNKDNDGPCNESEIDNQARPNAENSIKDINIAGPSIYNAISNINTASPTVNTVRQSDDFFGADNDMRSLDGVEVDISNISTTYPVPTTPNTRIHKDRSFDNVIGDMQFGVETRRMTVTTDEQGFISAIYEEKTHEDLHTWFEDLDYPDKVYTVEKALFGLHQDPRAWYETLAKYLLDNRFHRGNIDQTLFIKRQKEDILLVQVYVDDIIFGSTKKELWLQVKQKSYGIFIIQDKYVDEILSKFKYADVKPASTLMDKEKALLKDSDGDDVDVHLYRSKIGSLMYLTSSRPDIMFAVYSSFDLVAYTDSNYAGASLDRKSTLGGCLFLGCKLISWQCKKQTVVATSNTEAEYMATTSCRGQVIWIQNQLLDYRRSTINMVEFDIRQEDDKVCNSQMVCKYEK
nr:hypothetical protein [Tanacetum cinerariifolium]